MANEIQEQILGKGIAYWNSWRSKNPDVPIDLTRAHLRGIDLKGVNFRAVDLKRADLSEANLSKADLRSANLRRAYLTKADLTEADLSEANLTGSSLLGAFLKGTNLSNSNMLEAIIGGTVFMFTKIIDVKEIEGVVHEAPSSIGMETFYGSNGKIPVAFLRGCGLSDLQIEMAKLAAPGLDPEQVTDITYKIHQLYLGGGIQYYSCFISYSSKDQEFSQQLHDDLQINGVRCWFDREDLKIGDQIRPTIDHQIRLRDKLLVILSENSVKSEWVGDEVEGAIEEESKSNRLVLFPIRLDDTVLNTRDDWAARIKRRRHIGDFSNWQDKASYQKAFERLLRDLKASSDKSDKGASQ